MVSAFVGSRASTAWRLLVKWMSVWVLNRWSGVDHQFRALIIAGDVTLCLSLRRQPRRQVHDVLGTTSAGPTRTNGLLRQYFPK